ncbi:MAG: dipeptide epimerase [Rhizobiales bacterium]|nr:dipeptide epimerase [Hyphomicrobiales bacterium]OJY43063.1 MAG: dipeptide epimerase [Rhizobiales bacterium 64-17]
MNQAPAFTLTAEIEHWPIAGTFTISRGAKTEAAVVVATVSDGSVTGHGECVPYARYGESVESVAAAIQDLAPQIAAGLTRDGLQRMLRPGAARNALDCALWDIEAKRRGQPAHALAGLPTPTERITCYTISLDTPAAMQAAAERVAARKLLKVKLGRDGDPARIAAVRRGAPNAELVVDANEGWSAETLAVNIAACADAGVTLIEQPLPADRDDALIGFRSPVLICADESVHARPSLAALKGKYGAVNIKLDKTGGLTEALAMAADARGAGLRIMAGCMVGTSLAMAPAMLIAQQADVVDLDGPLLLARDRAHGLVYRDSTVGVPTPALWG